MRSATAQDLCAGIIATDFGTLMPKSGDAISANNKSFFMKKPFYFILRKDALEYNIGPQKVANKIMKTRTDLFTYFDQRGIAARTWQHEPLFTVEQANALVDSLPGAHVKNLFLKDDAGNFWLVVAEQHAQIELKKLRHAFNVRNLRFADADHLLKYIGVTPGSVTPFGLINDPEHAVRVVIDSSLFEQPMINAHPLENTATTSISIEDFKKFLRSTGHQIMVINFADYGMREL